MAEAVPERARRAVDRAAAFLTEGPENAWTAPSNFGRLGRFARRALLRAIRPYAIRQNEFNNAVVDALAAAGGIGAAAGGATALADLLPDDVVEVETDLGPLWLDATDNLITPLVQEHRSWEADVANLVRRALEPGMTFVDIGANFGYFCVLASRAVGETGRVLAFEPDPRTILLLRANLWRHRCTNAVVLPIAAHEHTGHVPFAVNADGRAGSRIDPERTSRLVVPCARLDDILDGTLVDVIKADVEAGEHLAIRGASETIRRSPGVVVACEFWPGQPHLGGVSPDDVLAYFESLGLELHLLRPDGSTEAASRERILAEGADVPIMNIVLTKGVEPQHEAAESS